MGKLSSGFFPGSRTAPVHDQALAEHTGADECGTAPWASHCGGHRSPRQLPSPVRRLSPWENLGKEGLKTLLQFGIIPCMRLAKQQSFCKCTVTTGPPRQWPVTRPIARLPLRTRVLRRRATHPPGHVWPHAGAFSPRQICAPWSGG